MRSAQARIIDWQTDRLLRKIAARAICLHIFSHWKAAQGSNAIVFFLQQLMITCRCNSRISNCRSREAGSDARSALANRLYQLSHDGCYCRCCCCCCCCSWWCWCTMYPLLIRQEQLLLAKRCRLLVLVNIGPSDITCCNKSSFVVALSSVVPSK